METIMKMLLKNKDLPEKAVPLVESLAQSGDKALFAIVGDMGLDGKYGETTLLFTAKKAVLYDASLPDNIFNPPISCSSPHTQ